MTVDDDQWTTWHSFYRMRRRLDRVLDLRLQQESGVSAAEYELLIALNRAEGRTLRIKEIASAVGWETSRVSHLVARMEKRGSIVRAPCETDRRGSMVGLTPAGRRIGLTAMRSHNAALLEYFFDQMDDAERQVLERISRRVTDAIGSDAEADPFAPGADDR